jgi:hypothetical protein
MMTSTLALSELNELSDLLTGHFWYLLCVARLFPLPFPAVRSPFAAVAFVYVRVCVCVCVCVVLVFCGPRLLL